MKAVVFTLGCKVNEVESAGIMAGIEKFGWETDDRLGYADVYVLNTCAVTREAERKSRQLISRVKKFNPAADIFVCGCASEKDKKSFEACGAAFVCGARKKDEVLDAFANKYGFSAQGLPYPKQTKTRAFVKIQDGCNNFCSYCVIPYLRGREVSRTIEDIVKEIYATDSREIVLNGINISSYNDGGKNLTDLIRALQNCDKRIRLGSLECNIIDDGFLSALKALKDFAPQFHLSLQSGSNAVLKAMNRHYTREEYLEKCKKVYGYFPSAAITTDVIAGFPAETEEDFIQSLRMIEEAEFARVHAFGYSPREGTAAFKMKQLPAEVKSERHHRLISAAEKAARAYADKFTGTAQEIIAEEYFDGYTCGYTGNYIRAYVSGRLTSGEKYKVILNERFKDGVTAKLYE